MEENKMKFDDNTMRQLMQSSKKEASENLKYRIMNQIEQEAVLKHKKQVHHNCNSNFLKDFYSIMGTMYAVLLILSSVAFIVKGKEFLLSTNFLLSILLIVFVFSFFWMISAIDERKRYKR